MRLPLAAILLLAGAASAEPRETPQQRRARLAAEAAAGSDCVDFAHAGCRYLPPSAGADPPLLIYIRGHHEEHASNVPPGLASESSRQAFFKYGLKAAADATGHAVLVTYKSSLGVTERNVRELAAALGRPFTRRVVAAHSGGYVGLGATLDNGLEFERVVVLDSFYSGSPALAQKIQARFPSGACRGFYTPHTFERRDGSLYDNEADFRADFASHAGGCAVDRLAGAQHNAGVNRCLPSYLRDQPCRP